ncbi:MAG: tripartite tricarboxylate transporter substrate binding protein [Sphaerochaeta sp.]|nr:tripartite tricarboxylate transporter substrate binding protein [Sphaerochaeta sp.]
MQKKRMVFISVLLVFALGSSLWAAGATEQKQQEAWPSRPVTLIVPYAAGGGTDVVARLIADDLQREYGMPFNVVNRDGGGGVVGHNAISTAEPDGYTIGLATFSLTTYKWFGSSNVTYENFTPIALFNIDSTAILVNEKSPYQNLGQLIDAIRANPNTLKMATPMGAGHHLAFSNLLDKLDIDPNTVTTVPVTGGAVIIQELAANGVDIGPSTLPESVGMIQAGKVRPLATLSKERSSAFPDVPTVKEAVGIELIGGTWRGLVAPKNMDKEIVDKLSASIKRIYDSSSFQDVMNKRGYGLTYLNSQDFYSFMKDMHEANGIILKKIGLIK